jgi:hypothetical protein
MILITKPSLLLLAVNSLLAQSNPDYGTPSAPNPIVLIFSLAICVLIIAAMWKVFAKGWSAWLGRDHPDLQPLHHVQGRRTSRLVVAPRADPVREFHYRNHPFHRHRQELRQGRRLRSRSRFSGIYFLANSRLWQRDVSRQHRADGYVKGASFVESLERQRKMGTTRSSFRR